MFKKTLLAVLLLTILAACSIAEETETMLEEELSPLVQCDERHNECAEKCGDPASESCLAQCQAVVDKCYAIRLSEVEDVSPEEAEPSEID